MGMIIIVQSLEHKDLKLNARFFKIVFCDSMLCVLLQEKICSNKKSSVSLYFFRLLIQIHDELVLEVRDDYIEYVKGKNLFYYKNYEELHSFWLFSY